MKGIGEQRQYWGTWNIENQDFEFGEQSVLFQEKMYKLQQGLRCVIIPQKLILDISSGISGVTRNKRNDGEISILGYLL